MREIDILRGLLTRLDGADEPVLTFEEVRRWPTGVLERFIAAGIVRKGPLARSTIYYDCPNHCDIAYDPTPHPRTGQAVSLHRCQHGECGGLVVIDADYFQLWEIVFDVIGQSLGRLLQLGGQFELLVPNRVCLLGTVFTGGGPLDVFWARALGRSDAITIFTNVPRFAAANAPVVIVPKAIPPPGLWQNMRPTILPLAEHVSWNTEAGCIDVSPLQSVIGSIRPPVPQEQWLTVSQCAELLANDLPYLDERKTAARVSRAAGAGKFVTNGKKGASRRIDRVSFDAWRLQQRDRDLDDDEESHFGDDASRADRHRHD